MVLSIVVVCVSRICRHYAMREVCELSGGGGGGAAWLCGYVGEPMWPCQGRRAGEWWALKPCLHVNILLLKILIIPPSNSNVLYY